MKYFFLIISATARCFFCAFLCFHMFDFKLINKYKKTQNGLISQSINLSQISQWPLDYEQIQGHCRVVRTFHNYRASFSMIHENTGLSYLQQYRTNKNSGVIIAGEKIEKKYLSRF